MYYYEVNINNIQCINEKIKKSLLVLLCKFCFRLSPDFEMVSFTFMKLRRHEIHKSKNKALAHLELQEKALKRNWKKQNQLAADSVEKRKLNLMREVRAKSVLSACCR